MRSEEYQDLCRLAREFLECSERYSTGCIERLREIFREIGRACSRWIAAIRRLLGIEYPAPVPSPQLPSADELERRLQAPRRTKLLEASRSARDHVDGRTTYLRCFH